MHWQYVNRDFLPNVAEVIDPKGWFRAKLWADGSVSVRAYSDRPHLEKDDEAIYASSTGIRVDDLDDLINRLTSLKRIQQESFGKLEPQSTDIDP